MPLNGSYGHGMHLKYEENHLQQLSTPSEELLPSQENKERRKWIIDGREAPSMAAGTVSQLKATVGGVQLWGTPRWSTTVMSTPKLVNHNCHRVLDLIAAICTEECARRYLG